MGLLFGTAGAHTYPNSGQNLDRIVSMMVKYSRFLYIPFDHTLQAFFSSALDKVQLSFLFLQLSFSVIRIVILIAIDDYAKSGGPGEV